MKRLFLLLPLLLGSFIMVHARTAVGQAGLAPVNPSQTASGPLPFTRPRAATPREASLSLSQSSMSYDTLGSYCNWIHSYMPYEVRANKHASKYFGKYYGVNWHLDTPVFWGYSGTIEDNYPLVSRTTL